MSDYLACGSCPSEFELKEFPDFLDHKRQADHVAHTTKVLECLQCFKKFHTSLPLLLHLQNDHHLSIVKMYSLPTKEAAAAQEVSVGTDNAHSDPEDDDVMEITIQPPPSADTTKISTSSSATTFSEPQPVSTQSSRNMETQTTNSAFMRLPHECDSTVESNQTGNSSPPQLLPCTIGTGCCVKVKMEENNEVAAANTFLADGISTAYCPCVTPACPNLFTHQGELATLRRASAVSVVASRNAFHAEDASLSTAPTQHHLHTSFLDAMKEKEPPLPPSAPFLVLLPTGANARRYSLPAQLQPTRQENIVSLLEDQAYAQLTNSANSASMTPSFIRTPTGSSTSCEPPAGLVEQSRGASGIVGRPRANSLATSIPSSTTQQPAVTAPAPRFVCQPCGRTFAQNIHLRKHVMSHHEGEKPHKCPMCKYATVERSHLTVHLRKHTGEKPFRCRNCDYSSAQNCTLKNHYFRKHPTSKVRCIRCSKEFVTNLERDNHVKSCLASSSSEATTR